MTDLNVRPQLLVFTPSRSAWSTRCARWSAAARIPFAVVRCVTVSAVLDEITAGPVYAVLADRSTVNPQLVAAARSADVPLVSVGGAGLHAHAALPEMFGVEELLHVLIELPRPLPVATPAEHATTGGRKIVAVIGSGGAGTSTVACLLAQGLAAVHSDVLLADLCRRAAHAVLHDIHTAIDGVMEIAHAPHEARGFLPVSAIPSRGYNLVLGMRQPLQWVALRDWHTNTIVDVLTAGRGTVVCDLDPEVESEQDTGSVGVGDRHRLTTAVLARADTVVVVVDASLMGVMRGVELTSTLLGIVAATVPVIVVVNRQRRADRWVPKRRFMAAFRTLLRAAVGPKRPVTITGLTLFDADARHMRVAAFPKKYATTLAALVNETNGDVR